MNLELYQIPSFMMAPIDRTQYGSIGLFQPIPTEIIMFILDIDVLVITSKRRSRLSDVYLIPLLFTCKFFNHLLWGYLCSRIKFSHMKIDAFYEMGWKSYGNLYLWYRNTLKASGDIVLQFRKGSTDRMALEESAKTYKQKCTSIVVV